MDINVLIPLATTYRFYLWNRLFPSLKIDISPSNELMALVDAYCAGLAQRCVPIEVLRPAFQRHLQRHKNLPTPQQLFKLIDHMEWEPTLDIKVS